jgi:cytochrome b
MNKQKPAAGAGSDVPGEEVRIWDPFVRLFHWSLVAAFAIAFVTGDAAEEEIEQSHGGAESFGMELHENAGYVVLGLVVFRIVWGLIGTKHARFSDFVYRPAAVLGYLADTVRLKAKRYLGHNPAGGAMVVTLLAILILVSGSGMMLTFDRFKDWRLLGELHETLANVTLGLVILHVIGVVVSSIEHRESLVKAMITGRKRPEKEPGA